MLPPQRVADAEYAKWRVLADVTETWFGTFVHDPAHADRAAATQLLDARLPSTAELPPTVGDDEAAQSLLEQLDSLYRRHDLPHRVVAGHDTETAVRLDPLLRTNGYEREDYRALVPDSTVPPGDDTTLQFDTRRHGSDEARAVHESVGRDPAGIEYTAAIAGALDGREVVVSRGGEPIGAAGWYVHDGAEGEDPVARFTHVGVRPDAQGEGVGAELVRAVVDRCPLPDERIVVCATSEHVGFYESVGFARIASLWRFARLP
ncbi:GNAT family N-acetyltransferase [Halolamina salina]|uniref:GNAT family N-acetyltransferase n=2 Tax=Halolamina salina TaxID=1220023 RepID=A0ABD6B2K0_9EURY